MVNNVATDINPSGVYSYGFDINASSTWAPQTIPAYQGADPTQPGQSISVNMNATPVLGILRQRGLRCDAGRPRPVVDRVRGNLT